MKEAWGFILPAESNRWTLGSTWLLLLLVLWLLIFCCC